MIFAGNVGSEEVVMAYLNCKPQQEQKIGHRILGSVLFLELIKDRMQPSQETANFL